MILNFFSVYFVYVLIIYLYTILNIFNYKYVEYCVFTNLISKLIFDEFYISLFYYVWSNFFFMFTFLLLIFIPIFIIKNISFFNKKMSMLFLFVFIYFYEYFDYFFFNFDSSSEYLSLKNYNVLLNNSINKLHPFLLYISIAYLITFLSTIFNFQKLKHNHFFYISNIYFTTITSLYLYLTLFMGGLWAYQEGSWGGWWDWDISEVFGLFIYLVFLVLIHHKNFMYNYYCYTLVMKWFVSLLLYFYIFMQLNFNLISHNFNLHISRNFMTLFFYSVSIIIIIFFFITLNFYASNAYIKYLSFYKHKIISKNFRFYIFVLIFLSTFVVSLSVFPILSNWIWNNFNLVFSFIYINFSDCMLLIVVLLNLIYFHLDLLSFISLFYFFIWHTTFITLVIISKYFSKLKHFLIHFLLYFIILFNILNTQVESSSWSFTFYGLNINFFYFYNTLKIESPFVVHSKNLLLSNLTKSQDFSWYYDFSVLDFKIFNLNQSLTTNTQTFFHDVTFYCFNTTISSRLEMTLIFAIFVIALNIYYANAKKSIIIF